MYNILKIINQMKSKKTIVMLSTLAAVCLASCDKNEEVNVNDGAVRFTAGIGREAVATPQTRAASTEWAAMDKIGIFMVDHGATSIAGTAENKQYVTGKGDGAFTPAIGHEIYYPMDDNYAVDFIAYYPYRDGAKLDTHLGLAIATTQTDATQAATDLMWAKADNSGSGYRKSENTTVALTFGHCLAKLTMNCKLDASVGVANLDGAKVTIHGMNTVSTFDLKTGKQHGTPENPADITPRKLATPTANFDATYDAIILPAGYSAGAVTVDFEIGSDTYTWNVDTVTFEAGNEYIYEVEITRSNVKVTGTINPWNPVTHQGPVYAE